MAINDFLPFATGGSANVVSQASYIGSTEQINGMQSGFAASNKFNKVWRQSSFVTAAIAQFMLNQLGIDILDDGNLPNFVTNFAAALWKSPALTGIPTTPTLGTPDNSTKIASTAFVQALILAILANSPALAGSPVSTTPVT